MNVIGKYGFLFTPVRKQGPEMPLEQFTLIWKPAKAASQREDAWVWRHAGAPSQLISPWASCTQHLSTNGAILTAAVDASTIIGYSVYAVRVSRATALLYSCFCVFYNGFSQLTPVRDRRQWFSALQIGKQDVCPSTRPTRCPPVICVASRVWSRHRRLRWQFGSLTQ